MDNRLGCLKNESNIPGAAGVIKRGNDWYCTVHRRPIEPLLVEVEGDEIACCEECALEDLIMADGDIVEPISLEGTSWECCT